MSSRPERHLVVQVGKFPDGVNPSSLSKLQFSGKLHKDGLQIGIVAGLVAITVNTSRNCPESFGIGNYLDIVNVDCLPFNVYRKP